MIDYALNESEEQRIQAFRAHCRDTLSATAAARDLAREFDRTALASLLDQGLLQAEPKGGDQLRPEALVGLWEAVAETDPGMWLATEASGWSLAALAAIPGTAAEQLRESLVAGEQVVAWAHSEAPADGQITGIQTTATREGDRFRIRGRKSWVTLAPVADVLLIVARSDGENPALFAVPAKAEGLRLHPLATTACRSTPVADVELDVLVDAEARLTDDATAAVTAARLRAAIGAAAGALGLIETGFEAARDHAMGHEINGRKLASDQRIHFGIADLRVQADGIRRSLGKAAGAWGSAHSQAPELVGIVRWYAADEAPKALRAAQALIGTAAMLEDHPLTRALAASDLLGRLGGGTGEWIDLLANVALDRT